jgi:hypothetical protein
VLDNLRDFAKAGAFKRAALEAIAFSMSAQSIKHLREQFSKMDKDQSGFVSVVQFMDALIGSGIDREEVRRTLPPPCLRTAAGAGCGAVPEERACSFGASGLVFRVLTPLLSFSALRSCTPPAGAAHLPVHRPGAHQPHLLHGVPRCEP